MTTTSLTPSERLAAIQSHTSRSIEPLAPRESRDSAQPVYSCMAATLDVAALQEGSLADHDIPRLARHVHVCRACQSLVARIGHEDVDWDSVPPNGPLARWRVR